MNRISKQLLKIAKEINKVAIDEQGDGSGFQWMHDKENGKQELLDIAEKAGKKYILHHKEKEFWRIQACKNFGDVKKGDLGGLIQSEKNLSHGGYCWVDDDAQVGDNARVGGNAKVYGDVYVDYDVSEGQITE